MINRKKIAHSLAKTQDELVIGFTASSSDLLHPGFLKVLAQANNACDYINV